MQEAKTTHLPARVCLGVDFNVSQTTPNNEPNGQDVTLPPEISSEDSGGEGGKKLEDYRSAHFFGVIRVMINLTHYECNGPIASVTVVSS